METTATPPIKRVTNRKSTKPKELLSSDVPMDTPADVDLGMPGESHGFDRPNLDISHTQEKMEVISADEQQRINLLFEEEEVTIEIVSEQGPDAPLDQFCGVNGVGIQEKINGTWVSLGQWAPVGRPFITKRKFVGVLLRAKMINIVTIPDKADGSQPRNIMRRNPAATHTVNILVDTPKGRDWAIQQIQQKG